MSSQAEGPGRPSVDVTVSNLDVPRDQVRDALISAIEAELERQATEEMFDLHAKSSVHVKS